MIKIKKTRKAKKQRGTTTHGWGARKKHKKSGHRGGSGMAGTGKRADQKKTLINKLYGNKYFGKQGITSRKAKKKKRKVINLGDIQKNIESFKNKNGEVELKEYKILGDGEFKTKITVRAFDFAKSAVEKIEKIGGKAISLKPSGKKATQSKKEKETIKNES